MDALYGCCSDRSRPVVLNADTPPLEGLEEAAERIAKGIFDGTITSGDIDPALTTLVAEKLRDAVIEGFGKDLPAIDYDTPDYAKLANLERNVYQFSAAKDYQQLKSITLALKDGDRIRTFKEFRDEALKISDVYVGAWLKTEYNTAVASAQMAAKWQRFYADKDILPLLQYRTVGDDRVRPSHQELDNVIRNIDDPFWDMYFPPNGWSCRCDVIQAVDGTETPDKDIITPDDVPKMFQTNMAKEGLVFPKGHPYYIGLPSIIIKQAEQLLAERIFNWGKKFLSGKTAQAAEIGEVKFTDAGLKNLMATPHQFLTEKNQVTYALKELVAHAPFDETVIKGRYKYHYYKIKIKEKPSWIVIKENAKGEKTVSSIVDKKLK